MDILTEAFPLAEDFDSPLDSFHDWNNMSILTNPSDDIRKTQLQRVAEPAANLAKSQPEYLGGCNRNLQGNQNVSTNNITHNPTTPSKKIASAIQTKQMNTENLAQNSKNSFYTPLSSIVNTNASTSSLRYRPNAYVRPNFMNQKMPDPRFSTQPTTVGQPIHKTVGTNGKPATFAINGNDRNNNHYRCPLPRLIQPNQQKTVRFKFQKVSLVQTFPTSKTRPFNELPINFGASTSSVPNKKPGFEPYLTKQHASAMKLNTTGQKDTNSSKPRNMVNYNVSDNNNPNLNTISHHSTAFAEPNISEFHNAESYEDVGISLPAPVTFTRDSCNKFQSTTGSGIADSNSVRRESRVGNSMGTGGGVRAGNSMGTGGGAWTGNSTGTGGGVRAGNSMRTGGSAWIGSSMGTGGGAWTGSSMGTGGGAWTANSMGTGGGAANKKIRFNNETAAWNASGPY